MVGRISSEAYDVSLTFVLCLAASVRNLICAFLLIVHGGSCVLCQSAAMTFKIEPCAAFSSSVIIVIVFSYIYFVANIPKFVEVFLLTSTMYGHCDVR